MLDDYRVERGFNAKREIFEALYTLLTQDEGSTLDGITISDICKQAGIARSKFYYYFHDKYDVVVWFVENLGAMNFGQIGLGMDLRSALLSWARTTLNYREFFKKYVGSKYYASIYAYLQKLTRDSMREAAQRHCDGELPQVVEVEIRYYLVALEAMYSDWARGVMVTTPESFVEFAIDLMPQNLRDLLENSAEGFGTVQFIDSKKEVGNGFDKGTVDDPSVGKVLECRRGHSV